MADVHSEEIRSYNMSRVRSTNTKPEILVRKFLFSKGLRFKLYDKKLPGKPDIILPKYRTLIFIHGCFWHGHENCKYSSIPKTRTEFWFEKIESNKRRDELTIEKLKDSGWNVLVVYGCELKPQKQSETLSNLLNKIESQFLE